METDVLPALVKKKNCKKKYTNKNNNFIDVDVPKDYLKVERFLSKNILKTSVSRCDGVINKDTGYVYKIKDFIWKISY